MTLGPILTVDEQQAADWDEEFCRATGLRLLFEPFRPHHDALALWDVTFTRATGKPSVFHYYRCGWVVWPTPKDTLVSIDAWGDAEYANGGASLRRANLTPNAGVS